MLGGYRFLDLRGGWGKGEEGKEDNLGGFLEIIFLG